MSCRVSRRMPESHGEWREDGRSDISVSSSRGVAVSSGGRDPGGIGEAVPCQHRTAARPFDVALEGRTDGATPDRGAKHLAPTCGPG